MLLNMRRENNSRRKAAKSLQSCPTLCSPTDGSPPGSPILGILQARTLEWVAISFSNAGKWKVKVKSLSRVQLLATPWTQPTRLLRPWDFPGKSTGVGCHCLLYSRRKEAKPKWKQRSAVAVPGGENKVPCCKEQNSKELGMLGTWIKVNCESEKSVSHVQLFATLWTIQSMEFSRPEYWNG